MALALPAFGQGGRDLEQSIAVAGTRSYRLHVPPAEDGKTALPLVVVLHGGGGNAEGMSRMTGFSDLADRKGFLAVYPNGTGRLVNRFLTWNSGNCCGFALDHGVNDTAFLRAIVSDLQKRWRVDPKRTFATGFSNGGMMSYRLGCEISDVLAAIAPVAGALNVEPCQPAQPVSVIAFNGTADRHVPYEGGRGTQQIDRHPRIDKSVADAISFWAKWNGCSRPPARREKGPIVREVYAPCQGGTVVELVTIREGGHAWPGGKKWAPWADPPTTEISANEAMWEFFASHPKR